MRLAMIVACAVWMTVCSVLPGSADKRAALVIGNAAYDKLPRLINPKNDAEDVGAKLRQLGFETIVATDLDRGGFNAALDRFSRVVTDADIAVIYYAGHGMQFAGTNYLLPVDASLDGAEDVNRFRLTPVDDVLETLRLAKGARVLVLDACRNNPVEAALKRQLAALPGANRDTMSTRGFKPLAAGNGLLIAYATQANDVANDGTGRNSPFTSAFLKHVDTPDIDIRTMLFRVQDEVDVKTNHQQRPELSISLIGEFKLKIEVKVVAGNPSPDAAKPVPGPAIDPAAQAWAAGRDTGSVAVLEDFIRRYGDSFYGTLARERLDQLKKTQTAVLVPPAAPPRPTPVTPAVVAPPPVPPPSDRCGDAAMVSFASRCAAPLSQAQERDLKPQDRFQECVDCPEMVVVPAGSFTMGSARAEKERYDNEGPQHLVKIPKPFAAGKFHVTVDQFAAFVAATGHDAGSKCQKIEEGRTPERAGRSWRNPGFAQAGSHPAVCLNWNDASAYAQWLTETTGKDYRLLTEAEWEYATRAKTSPGSYPRFFFGGDENDLCRHINAASCLDAAQNPFPVGSFPANDFGLHDMAGNAWQWTQDCYHNSYRGAPAEGAAWDAEDCTQHILRGGSWASMPKNLRAAVRGSDDTAGNGWDQAGFRVARTLLTP